MLLKHGLAGLTQPTAAAGGGITLVSAQTTEGTSAEPWSISGFSVTNGNKYFIHVMSTLADVIEGVDLGTAAAALALPIVTSDDAQTLRASHGVVEGWIATANTTGSVAIEVTQTTGGTKDVCIALYDITGYDIVDDDSDVGFANAPYSIARTLTNEGGTGIPIIAGAIFTTAGPETIDLGGVNDLIGGTIDLETQLTNTLFVLASKPDTAAGVGTLYDIRSQTESIEGAAHSFWFDVI
jgi:hypothetical protein